jgi:hypothetical protein
MILMGFSGDKYLKSLIKTNHILLNLYYILKKISKLPSFKSIEIKLVGLPIDALGYPANNKNYIYFAVPINIKPNKQPTLVTKGKHAYIFGYFNVTLNFNQKTSLINGLFDSELKHHIEWNGTNESAIVIHYGKIKIDGLYIKKPIKVYNEYPRALLEIYTTKYKKFNIMDEKEKETIPEYIKIKKYLLTFCEKVEYHEFIMCYGIKNYDQFIKEDHKKIVSFIYKQGFTIDDINVQKSTQDKEIMIWENGLYPMSFISFNKKNVLGLTLSETNKIKKYLLHFCEEVAFFDPWERISFNFITLSGIYNFDQFKKDYKKINSFLAQYFEVTSVAILKNFDTIEEKIYTKQSN